MGCLVVEGLKAVRKAKAKAKAKAASPEIVADRKPKIGCRLPWLRKPMGSWTKTSSWILFLLFLNSYPSTPWDIRPTYGNFLYLCFSTWKYICSSSNSFIDHNFDHHPLNYYTPCVKSIYLANIPTKSREGNILCCIPYCTWSFKYSKQWR